MSPSGQTPKPEDARLLREVGATDAAAREAAKKKAKAGGIRAIRTKLRKRGQK